MQRQLEPGETLTPTLSRGEREQKPELARRSDDLPVRLRRQATDVENSLWRLLRDRQLAGAKFRRQAPIGPYVVDFLCLEAKLVVELDGGQHADEDGTRQHWLETQGYQVLRFWNNEIISNVEGVLATIVGALG